MKLSQQIVEALESLTSNKMRSGLTILGIVIGVAAVISMLAIGRGAQASIDQSIQSIGTNLLFITAGGNNVRNPQPLTTEQASVLADPSVAPDVAQVGEALQSSATVTTAAGGSTRTTVMGVTINYAALRNLTIGSGSMFSTDQLNSSAAVAVIGTDVATTLFNTTTNVVGDTIIIAGQPFQVIGLLQNQGGSSFGSANNQILVPITTAQSRLIHRGAPDQLDQIVIQATNANTVNAAQTEVTAILNNLHHIPFGGTSDFSVLNQAQLLSSAASITGVLTLFLGGIGAISLLVGGIGIMNIMLVSVTERTREIGLRKALGARRIDILVQFLMESAILGLIGGILGIAVAEGISTLIAQIASASSTPIHPLVGLDAVLLATLFSIAVGVFFGFYPANRAARLEPVEALRYE